MKRSVILLSLVLMGGCAAGNGLRYEDAWLKRDGSTKPEVTASDEAKCRYEAAANARRSTPGLQSMVGVEYDLLQSRKELFKLCMEARDYYVTKIPVARR